MILREGISSTDCTIWGVGGEGRHDFRECSGRHGSDVSSLNLCGHKRRKHPHEPLSIAAAAAARRSTLLHQNRITHCPHPGCCSSREQNSRCGQFLTFSRGIFFSRVGFFFSRKKEKGANMQGRVNRAASTWSFQTLVSRTNVNLRRLSHARVRHRW